MTTNNNGRNRNRLLVTDWDEVGRDIEGKFTHRISLFDDLGPAQLPQVSEIIIRAIETVAPDPETAHKAVVRIQTREIHEIFVRGDSSRDVKPRMVARGKDKHNEMKAKLDYKGKLLSGKHNRKNRHLREKLDELVERVSTGDLDLFIDRIIGNIAWLMRGDGIWVDGTKMFEGEKFFASQIVLHKDDLDDEELEELEAEAEADRDAAAIRDAEKEKGEPLTDEEIEHVKAERRRKWAEKVAAREARKAERDGKSESDGESGGESGGKGDLADDDKLKALDGKLPSNPDEAELARLQKKDKWSAADWRAHAEWKLGKPFSKGTEAQAALREANWDKAVVLKGLQHKLANLANGNGEGKSDAK